MVFYFRCKCKAVDLWFNFLWGLRKEMVGQCLNKSAMSTSNIDAFAASNMYYHYISEYTFIWKSKIKVEHKHKPHNHTNINS